MIDSARLAKLGINEHTTMEMLDISPAFYRTAVIPYHDYVVHGIHHGTSPRFDYSVAIYSFDTADHGIEDPISLIDYLENFDDLGDAVRAGLNYCECLKAQQIMKGRYST